MGDTVTRMADFATFGSGTLLKKSGITGEIKGGVEDVTGITAAADAAKLAKKGIKKQQQKENIELAEKDDEIARRRRRGGQRTSLIATSPRGVQNLGG